MQRRLVKSESPVVENSFRRKQMTRRSHAAFTWVFVNVVLAAAFFGELAFGSVAHYFEIQHPLMYFGVLLLALWFTFCFAIDLYHYMRPVLGQNSVLLSQEQRLLLGIRPTESGFKLAPVETPSYNGSVSPTIIPSSSPSIGMPSNLINTPPRLVGTPPRSNTSSPRTPVTGTPSFYNETVSTPDSRSRQSSPARSPFHSSACMTDLDSLTQYIREQEEEQERLQRVSQPDPHSLGRGQAYWSSHRYDFTPPLNVYRIARRSPDLSLSRDDDESGYNSTKAEDVWVKLHVTRTDLDHWTENCRKWLCQTILVRLVSQIEAVNEILTRIGCSELQLGTVNLGAGRQVALTKADQVPSLGSIIPYLEASNNQEYLVQRLSELAQGGCMGLYRWNSGGQYRGKAWEQDLLADSQLVLRMFCTYMDSRLPADPTFPDRRTFTGLHFLKTPDKPDARKSDLCIYQSRLHPPHFKVIVEDEVFDMPKGQNNLFHTIIFFLHHVKTKRYGMLGRVNLGKSGVNILCILNKK
ncbi:transmembrane protein 209-like isoform X1 [Acropora palmata]|uniref:transmembrane protein 209-like isoform X1 n=1 Tax=Acropora palmata TaxID=6131 RepID=UPI003DA0A073